MKSTRREFLSKTVLGALSAGLALHMLRPEDLLALPQTDRAFQAARSGIFLDGAMAGWLESVEGGHATSDVVTGKFGLPAKQIAGVKYEDLTLNCGTGMSKAFYEWIKASFDGQAVRKSGAIVNCDFNYKEISRTEFMNALVTQVTFPALDASSRSAAKMAIKISPESTRMTQAAASAASAALRQAVQKKWLPSNFRLTIDGLDCTRVNKIDAITTTLQPVKAPGLIRTVQATGSQAHKLSISLPDSAQVAAWQKASVVGSPLAGKKNGQLDYLSEDMRETLFTLTFRDLGILNILPDKVSADSEDIKRVKVEMYCEEIRFNYGSAWA